MTTRYPLAPLMAKTGDESIYDLADRMGVSHARIVELATHGLSEKQVDDWVVGKLRIHPANVVGWEWFAADELERYVAGAPDRSGSDGMG